MLNRCRRPAQIVLFYSMLIWLGTMLLFGNLLALPLILTPKSFRAPLVQWGISTICRLFLSGCAACGLMKLDLKALDALNGQSGLLLAPNHPSMIDAFLILSRMRRVVCLMKASIGSNLFLGAGARLAGYVSNRDSVQMFREAIRSIDQGNIVLIFPEGTRTTHQPVNPIKGAATLIAHKAQSPVQTILITTNSAYLSKGWKIWRPPEFPIVYRAIPGIRFTPEADMPSTTRRLQQHFHASLERSIDPALRLDR
jgi:1-acyl-sn-glycerol-3-phosphate acyltransferase